MSKKPRLGLGAGALFGASDLDDVLASTRPAAGEERLKDLPLDLLQRGKYQPRTHMDQAALEELAESIKAQGVVQPIVVREIGGGRYEIVAGERRWRAAQLAQLATIPAVIRNIPDEAAIAVALIENIQRENLNPIEEAAALQRLADEFQLTHEETAASVGRSRVAVTNLMRLLTLEPAVQELLQDGTLGMGHGRALLALNGKAQIEAAREIARRGLSVRETEVLVRNLQGGAMAGKNKPPARQDPDIRALQERLSEKLGTSVHIQSAGKGKGKLVIEYGSNDELDGILAHFR